MPSTPTKAPRITHTPAIRVTKVRPPTTPYHRRKQQHQQPLETITLVHPYHSDPEEDLVTITTQATLESHDGEDQVTARTVPGILVTDIRTGTYPGGADGLEGTTLSPLPGGIASHDPHHTTTTTTATSTITTTKTTTTTTNSSAPCLPSPKCVPADPSTKASAPLQRPRGKAAKQGRRGRPRGSTAKNTTTTKPPPPQRQARSMLGKSRSGESPADTRHTLNCESKPAVTPSPQPAPCPGDDEEATTTPTHHHPRTTTTTRPKDVVTASADVAFTTPPTTCSFCKAVSGAENTFTSLSLKASLPQSLLKPTSLLQHCLGVPSPADATPTHGAGLVKLCRECHALLCEGDQALHRLMEVAVSMRQRWPSLGTKLSTLPSLPPLPASLQENKKEQQTAAATTTTTATVPVIPAHAPPEVARRLRRILPKPSRPVPCGLCGTHLPRMVEWHQHAITQHKLTPRWTNPKLLPSLKMCLTKELKRGSGQRGTRRCPACIRSFPRQKEFVEHLRGHHNMMVDDDFLSWFGRGAVKEEEGGGDDSWLSKEEEENTVKTEEQIIKEEEEIVKDREQNDEEVEEEEDEEEVEEEEEEEEDVAEEKEELKSRAANVKEKQQPKPHLEECPKDSGIEGRAARQGHVCSRRQCRGKWRCRVCAAAFSSQREHDLHKATKHPGFVRAGRGRTQPGVPHNPHRKGGMADGGQKDPDSPAAASEEVAIVILEGDGHGGVTHRRLPPVTTPEASQQKARPSQTAATSGFPCLTCAKVFPNRLGLVGHQRAAHPGDGDGVVLVECPLCGRRLAGSGTLRHHLVRVHRRTSHPPLRYQCRQCLCQCHTRAQLDRHMRERHGAPPPPPPVRCSRCGKMYSARYIDTHLANMHGEGARFPCSFCPMKFEGRGSLQAHVSLEHANTTWTCQECPMQFAKYHQLRQHRVYVHSRTEHRCPECPRTFKRRSDLTEHTKRRHQERQPQECSFCPKVYSDRKRLRMHLMRKHGVAWEDTLARGYARRQRESNCLRRRQKQPQSPQSPSHEEEEEEQPPREEDEGGQGDMVEGQPEYSVVHLTDPPTQPLVNAFSYIILEEA